MWHRLAPSAVVLNFFWKVEMDKLLDVFELGEVLGRSAETIKKDLKRNPVAVPPRVHLPGTRLLRWRPADVDAWLAEYVVGGK
jgi:predicted DNA-binding transcriptional regulator AlpA